MIGPDIIVIMVAVGVVLFTYRHWIRPARDLCALVGRMRQGDPAIRFPRPRSRWLLKMSLALEEIHERAVWNRQMLQSNDYELRMILGSMVEGVLVLDGESRVRIANDRVMEIFGLEESPVGRPLLESIRNHELQRLVLRILEEGGAAGMELSIDHPHSRYLEVNAVRIRGAQSHLPGVLTVFHDITRIKNLEKVRKEFVANASHELRTPLSIIRGYTETLVDGAVDDPETARKFVQVMYRHTERLSSLVDDLLELSRVESGQIALQVEPTDVPKLLEKAAFSLQAVADRRSIRVVVRPEASVRQWPMDGRLMERVLSNLLDNAIKYSPPGSEVRVGGVVSRGELLLQVSDQGEGIPEADLPRIFERFYRVDKARSKDMGGTGLGLSIAKHIVQSHGGRIWAESVPGRGATFHIALPAPAAGAH